MFANPAKIMFGTTVFALFFGIIGSASALTLDYGQCKTVYLQDETNSSIYNKTEICAINFPRINASIELNEDTQFYLLPDYNLSVTCRIPDEITYELSDETDQRLTAVEQKVGELDTNFQGINTHINTELGNLRAEMNSQFNNISGNIAMINNQLYKSSSSGGTWKIWVAVISIIAIIGTYLLFKLRIIKPPHERTEDYQTPEDHYKPPAAPTEPAVDPRDERIKELEKVVEQIKKKKKR